MAIRKKRILIVVPSLAVHSGVASSIMSYYPELLSDFKIDFMVYEDDDGKYREEIIKNGGKIYEFKKLGLKQINNFFKENARKYDVIHCHTFNYGLPYLRAAKKYGIKKRVLHVHSVRYSDNLLKHFINNVLMKFCRRNSDAFIACSEQVGKKVFKHRAYSVVTGGVKKLEFNEAARQSARDELGIEDDQILFGNVGRLVRQKNQKFVISLFAELKKTKRFFNSKLLIIGSGPKKARLVKLTRKYNLMQSVIILDNTQEIEKYYAAMDCFLFPSKAEGLGLAVVEAQSMGLPTFCNDTLPKEIFATELAQGLSIKKGISLWVDEIMKSSLIRKDPKVAEGVFSTDRQVMEISKIYRDEIKKKAVYFIPTLENGGTEKYLLNLLKSAGSGYENIVVVYDKHNYWKKDLEELGVKVVSIDKPAKTGLRGNYQAVKKIIEEQCPDVVCAYTYYNAAYILTAALLCHVKTRIAHVHTSATDHAKTPSYKLYVAISRLLVSLVANRRLACSEQAGKTLFIRKFQVAKNGIDLMEYQYDEKAREKIRKKLQLKEDDLVIGTVGRLDENKNQSFLIDAFSELCKKEVHAKLVIIGDGPSRKTLEDKVAEKDLSEKVTFVGRIKNAAEYYSALDVFALTSYKEGLPFVLIEAQANGLPIVSSTAPTAEAKLNRNFRFLELNNNPEKWAKKLDEALKLGRVKQGRKLKEFSIEKSMAEIKPVYYGGDEASEPLKVSVIIPAYNAGKYVEKCIKSITAQTYENIEIIVVNDGSTDNTDNVVRGLLSDDRIKYISQANLSANIARGVGVKHATGDFCMFVDADDWIKSSAIETLVDKLGASKCDIIKFGPRLQPDFEFDPKSDLGKRTLILDPSFRSLCFGMYSTKLLKKSSTFKNESSYAEDYLANIDICSKANKILTIKSDLYHYRKNSGSTTVPVDERNASKNMEEGTAIFRQVMDVAKTWGVDDEQFYLMLLDDVKWLIYGFKKTHIANDKVKKMIKKAINTDLVKSSRRNLGEEEFAKSLNSRSLPYRLKYSVVVRGIYTGDTEVVYRQYLWHKLVSKIWRAA